MPHSTQHHGVFQSFFASSPRLHPAAVWFLKNKRLACPLCNLIFWAVLAMYNDTATATPPPASSRCSKVASVMKLHHTVIFQLRLRNATFVCLHQFQCHCLWHQTNECSHWIFEAHCLRQEKRRWCNANATAAGWLFFIYLPRQVHFEYLSKAQCGHLTPMHLPCRLIVICHAGWLLLIFCLLPADQPQCDICFNKVT